jgi:hypothetical protein
MRSALLAAFTLLATSSISRADLMLGPNVFVEQSIKAHGGAAKIDKYRAEVMKLEGTLIRDGKEYAFTGESVLQLPSQFKHVVRFEVDGKKHETIAVFNGDKGWRKRDGATEDMSTVEMTQAKDLLHAFKVARMTSIPNDRTYQLTNLQQAMNAAMIGDQRAWGINVAVKGEKNVVLYIGDDKKLLLKLERNLQVDAKKTAKLEEFFSDYREVNGVQRAFKRLTLIDGNKVSESKSNEINLYEQVDEKRFERP